MCSKQELQDNFMTRQSPGHQVVVSVVESIPQGPRGHDACVQAVSAELLCYGIRVLQALVSGGMPVPRGDEDMQWAHPAVGALVKEMTGLGLDEREAASLLVRVLAFTELVEMAGTHAGMSAHVLLDDDGIRVSERFLSAAASAQLRVSADGVFGYDLDSVVAGLQRKEVT